MNADLPRDEPCPRCLGSGSGIYNALSPKSTCEVCDGSGLRDVHRRKPSPRPRPRWRPSPGRSIMNHIRAPTGPPGPARPTPAPSAEAGGRPVQRPLRPVHLRLVRRQGDGRGPDAPRPLRLLLGQRQPQDLSLPDLRRGREWSPRPTGPTRTCPDCDGKAFEASSGLACLTCKGRGFVPDDPCSTSSE